MRPFHNPFAYNPDASFGAFGVQPRDQIQPRPLFNGIFDQPPRVYNPEPVTPANAASGRR
jgi:hypothetical protein